MTCCAKFSVRFTGKVSNCPRSSCRIVRRPPRLTCIPAFRWCLLRKIFPQLVRRTYKGKFVFDFYLVLIKRFDFRVEAGPYLWFSCSSRKRLRWELRRFWFQMHTPSSSPINACTSVLRSPSRFAAPLIISTLQRSVSFSKTKERLR